VAVHENNGAGIGLGGRVGIRLECRRQRLRCFVKRMGVEEEVSRWNIAAVHDGIVWLRIGDGLAWAVRLFLLHRVHLFEFKPRSKVHGGSSEGRS
jgi:hypothetical protein